MDVLIEFCEAVMLAAMLACVVIWFNAWCNARVSKLRTVEQKSVEANLKLVSVDEDKVERWCEKHGKVVVEKLTIEGMKSAIRAKEKKIEDLQDEVERSDMAIGQAHMLAAKHMLVAKAKHHPSTPCRHESCEHEWGDSYYRKAAAAGGHFKYVTVCKRCRIAPENFNHTGFAPGLKYCRHENYFTRGWSDKEAAYITTCDDCGLETERSGGNPLVKAAYDMGMLRDEGVRI